MFEFSEFPGEFGVPVVGVMLALVALLSVQLSSQGRAISALIILLIGMPVVVAVSRWLTQRGTSRIPWLRSRSANLVARRGNPSVWLVAHLDSKSQTIPMLARIASIVIVVLSIVALAASVLLRALGTSAFAQCISISGIVAALAAVPLVLCFTGNQSVGAVDNGTGVVAVLLAARALSARPDIGVILTSGEELGLAGARAYVQSHPTPSIALNCDTADDEGGFLCMVSGARRAAQPAIARAATRLGLTVKTRSMLPGILADSMAFADAGWDSITLSRGNLGTLARVHTSSDTTARLNGTGIAKAGRLLAASIEELG